MSRQPFDRNVSLYLIEDFLVCRIRFSKTIQFNHGKAKPDKQMSKTDEIFISIIDSKTIVQTDLNPLICIKFKL